MEGLADVDPKLNAMLMTQRSSDNNLLPDLISNYSSIKPNAICIEGLQATFISASVKASVVNNHPTL